MVRLALYKGEGNRYDKLIKVWTRSKYSHCELVVERDGSDLWLSASPRDGGVRAKQISPKLENWDYVALPWVSSSLVLQRFEQIEGRPYDWVGIFANQVFAAPFNSTAFFCSKACGFMTLLPDFERYNPAGLGRICSTWQPVKVSTRLR